MLLKNTAQSLVNQEVALFLIFDKLKKFAPDNFVGLQNLITFTKINRLKANDTLHLSRLRNRSH